jgi:hypothetical protein
VKFIDYSRGYITGANGTILAFEPPWQKCLGGPGNDVANSIQKTSDGGYIIVGYSEPPIEGPDGGDLAGLTRRGGKDFWIVKLSSAGEIQWQKLYGGSGQDIAYSVQQTTDGGYIVAGNTKSNDGDVSGNHTAGEPISPTYDIWVIKLNSIGELEWQRCYGGTGEDIIGSVDVVNYNDNASHSIQQTSDGGYIFAGYTDTQNNGDVLGNHLGGELHNIDFWVVKLYPNGNINWQKCLGGTERERAYFVKQTSDGNYIIAGSACSYDGDLSRDQNNTDEVNIWIVKLSSDGTNIMQNIDFGGPHNQIAYSLQESPEGFVTAGFNSNGNYSYYGVTNIISNLQYQWIHSIGITNTQNQAFEVQKTDDNGYVVAGSASGAAYGNRDYYILKLSSSGTIDWQKYFGGSGDDEARSILDTSDGGFAIAGSTSSNDVDISGNHGGLDFWILRLSPSGKISLNN